MKLKIGPIALVTMTICLAACATAQTGVKTVPDYSAEFLMAVDRDFRTCGPAAKEALFDWAVMAGI